MIRQIRDAAARAVVLGVEWAVVIAIVLFAVNYLLGIRDAALKGAEAHAYIVQQIQQQRAQTPVTPGDQPADTERKPR